MFHICYEQLSDQEEMFILQCRSRTLKLDNIDTHKYSDISQSSCSSQVFMENGFVHEAEPWSNHSMVCYPRLSPFKPQASNFCHASMRRIRIGYVYKFYALPTLA